MILAVGLSPAWQEILVFDHFALGDVNRVRERHACASGKVVNVAVALRHLGDPCRLLTVVGGEPVANDLGTLKLADNLIRSDEPTRVCSTLVDHHRIGL